MFTQDKKLLYTSYDYILCDSKDALSLCYEMGLDRKIKVLTNSPAILLDKNINSKPFSTFNTKSKIVKFQKSILQFSFDLYSAVKKNRKIDIELATLIGILGNQFNNFLLKGSYIQNKLLDKKIIFIKIDSQLPNASNINPPWDYFKKQLKFQSYSFCPSDYNNINKKNDKQANFIKRFYLGGIETFLYRLIIKFGKYKFFNLKKNIFIINENEIIIELTSKLFSSGFKITDLRNIKKINVNPDHSLIAEIKKLTSKTLKKRVKKWVIPELEESCIDYFFSKVEANIISYLNWKYSFEKKISKMKKKEYLNMFALINHPSSIKGLAIKNICNKYDINLCACQHGVTAEISGSHDYCLSQHDSSSSNIYFSFNKGSANIAKKNPFKQTHKEFIYGAPKRYKRSGKVLSFSKKFEVLYLSNNLYTGNTGGIATWCSDLEKAQIELKLIDLLEKVNKKVTYKPYPEINKRYYEENPTFIKVKKSKNINLIKKNYDSRYLLSNSKLLICATATSTVAWALMSKVPTIFINFNRLAPLKKEAYDSFKKGLFLCDYDSKKFSLNFLDIVNKDIEQINSLWEQKRKYRNKLINDFISTNNKRNLKEIFN